MNHLPYLSRAAAAASPFLAMEVMERAQVMERAGIDVVHLEVGEPDFRVPECVADALASAARNGDTHYTHSLGKWELREAIAARYARIYGVTVSPEQVVVTSGTSGGLVLLTALLLNPEDEVLLPDPGYACYPNFVLAAHGVPRRVPTLASEGYRLDAAAVGSFLTERTRALLVNSPGNPTAAVQPRDALEALAQLSNQHPHLALISDEIYHGLEYGAEPGHPVTTRATSMLEVTNRCFVLDGFSKRYAMTGLRIGWLVAPPEYVPALQRLAQNLFISASSVAQAGALAALRGADADIERMRQEYARRRELMVSGLRRLGFGVPVSPAGAYYTLADARHLDSDSVRLAHRILDEAKVGVAPGIDFGPSAEGHLRFSFASASVRIEEGLHRLANWLA